MHKSPLLRIPKMNGFSLECHFILKKYWFEVGQREFKHPVCDSVFAKHQPTSHFHYTNKKQANHTTQAKNNLKGLPGYSFFNLMFLFILIFLDMKPLSLRSNFPFLFFFVLGATYFKDKVWYSCLILVFLLLHLSTKQACSLNYRSRALKSRGSQPNSVLFLQRSQCTNLYFYVVQKPMKVRCGS